MNIVNILEEIEKVDGEIYERLSPRRKAMKEFWSMGGKIAAAAMPLALGSMFNKAYGATPAVIVEILQYALTLEHFEYNFYKQGLQATTLVVPTTPERAALEMIRDSELKHVNFLKTVLSSPGINQTPVAEKTNYDFTAANTFPTVFSNYATFLAVAQVLEDTGVRAYKGRAGELKGEKDILTAALNIHAVEARHAAKIRYMRRMNATSMIPNLKPWITGGNDSGAGNAVNGNYGGAMPESNVIQGGVDITTLKLVGATGANISVSAATEAFDEPLTKAEVLALVAPFGVS
jgi:rubrerythrin